MIGNMGQLFRFIRETRVEIQWLEKLYVKNNGRVFCS